MIDYQQLKEWFKDKENQKKLFVVMGFILTFFIGFGSGRYQAGERRVKLQSNYTTFSTKKPGQQANKEADAVKKVDGVSTTTPAKAADATTSCIVKGNISSAGKKIYHIKGGTFYSRVKPEQCFDTQAQAQAAGFVKSSR